MKNKRTSLFSEVTPVIKNRYYGVKNELLKPESIIKGAATVKILDDMFGGDSPSVSTGTAGQVVKRYYDEAGTP